MAMHCACHIKPTLTFTKITLQICAIFRVCCGKLRLIISVTCAGATSLNNETQVSVVASFHRFSIQ